MSIFVFVALVIGWIVIIAIGIFLLTVILYAVSALIAFIALCLKLNTKGTSKAVIQSHSTFDGKGDCANCCTNTSWPRQYVKYVVGNYFQIVWGNGWVSNVFNCLAKTKYSRRNNDSPKDINNLIPIPRNEKSLDGIHADNLPEGKAMSTKNERYRKKGSGSI